MNDRCGCQPSLDLWKEIRARYFLEYVRLAEAHENKPLANRQTLAEIRVQSARELGKKIARNAGETTVRGLYKHYLGLMPDAQIVVKGGRLIVETETSLIADGMREIGVADEQLLAWRDLLAMEHEIVRGYNPELQLECTHSHLAGDAISRWEMAIPDHDDSLSEGGYASFRLCDTCTIRTWAYVSARYFTDLIQLAESLEADPRQSPRELAFRLRWDSALEQGRRTAAQTGDAHLTGLQKHYWSRFPNVKVIEHEANDERERMVCRADSCNFCQGFQQAGLAGNQLAEVGKLACIPDEAFILGMIPDVKFEMPSNQMRGDDHCTWVLTVEKDRNRNDQTAE